MKKLLVSKYAGKAERVINSKKPSNLIPFKGKFPLLPQWRRDEWNEIIDNNMYTEDCPTWAQDIMFQGSRIVDIEDNFVYYLQQNNIPIEDFKKKNNSDKATELVRFFNANSLTLDSLVIN